MEWMEIDTESGPQPKRWLNIYDLKKLQILERHPAVKRVKRGLDRTSVPWFLFSDSVQRHMRAELIFSQGVNVLFVQPEPSAAISVSYENGGLRLFSCFARFLVRKIGINSEKCIEYGKQWQSELPDVNINTSAQSINTENHKGSPQSSRKLERKWRVPRCCGRVVWCFSRSSFFSCFFQNHTG